MANRTVTLKRGEDTIIVTVLENGDTRMDVQGEISYANHGSAEEALADIEKQLGGQTDVQSHGHAHHHHAHGAHTHTHKE